MSTITYYIYENWRAASHKAVIHRGSCIYCNEGEGTSHGGYDRSNGKWHGRFDTLEAAKEYRDGMAGVKIKKECSICL